MIETYTIEFICACEVVVKNMLDGLRKLVECSDEGRKEGSFEMGRVTK